MSAHIVLNLLDELGKRDKMRGLSSILSRQASHRRDKMLDKPRILSLFPNSSNKMRGLSSILSLFRNEFNKFNKT